MECVIRLYNLGILPQNFWEEIEADGDEDNSDPGELAERPSIELYSEAGAPASTSTSNIGGVLNWFTGNREVEPSPEEREAEKRTLKCIENCNIRDLFRDTKFLQLEALLELVRSITWTSGGLVRIVFSVIIVMLDVGSKTVNILSPALYSASTVSFDNASPFQLA